MNSKKNKLSLVILFTMLSMFGYSQTQNTRPNIILIFADDLGYTDVGFNRPASFPSEYGVIPTPEIDALATNGVIAKNAHVAHPFCGPSRAALLTGVYPHRICAQYNLPNSVADTDGVSTNEKFFSKVLQENNYNTAAIGKWHVGVSNNYIPNNRGFDYFFGMLGGGHQYFESDYETQFYNSGGTVTNEYRVPLLRNQTYVTPAEFNNDEYLTDILTEEAVNYINTNAADTDPFFMYLAYNAPHTPLQAPQAKIDVFDAANGDGTVGSTFSTVVAASPDILNANVPSSWTGTEAEYRASLVEDRLIYATMVSIMDEGVGLVKDALVANNILDNTLIIFMSDNGGKLRQAGAVNFPLTAGKGSVDEGGHRVPMFFHWPDELLANQTYDHLVSSIDLYPSFLELAGATAPTGKLLEGEAVMNKIVANQDARPGESIYIMRPQLGFQNGAIMRGDYKISKKGSNNTAAGFKLYNIITDPGETTDIRSTEPNAETIIDDMLNAGVAWVSDFQDVTPCFYDNGGDGSGHPHSFLWNDGTLPNYDGFFGMPLITDPELVSILADTDAVEGLTDGIFTVSLPTGVLADQDITVTYTVSGEATAGTDFTSLTGTLTILEGTNSTDITITASEDGIAEGSETVIIELASTSIGTINTTPAEITILDVVIPTTLTAGDIAIVGWRAGSGNNGNGALAFMLLKDINATTKISFSTRSWSTSGWTGDYSIDDVWTWTTDNNYNTGDIFMLDADGLVKRVIGDAEVTVGTTSHDHTGKISESSDGDFDISTGGEGILVYQVDPFVLPTDPNSSNWITGINTNGGWGTGGGNTFCALPTALTNGVNANAVGTDQDNGVYTGAIIGTPSELRASINDSANWISNETTNYNLWRFDLTSGGTNGDIGMSGTLSAQDFENNNDIKVFPNPSQGYFTIQINKDYNNIDIEIISISGKSIKKINLNDETSIKVNISDFASGLYILKLKSPNSTSYKKIMKL